jgi:lysozyme family protein
VSSATWPEAFAALLKHEGGFVNHPKDPGGMTNLGVTKRTWEDWINHPVNEEDMRALRPGTVEPLYRQRYWAAIRGDELPAGIDYATFDYAVNSGVSRAASALQAALGAKQDGVIGPKSLAAAHDADPEVVINELCDARLAFLRGLPTWPTFGKGWWSRVEQVRAKARDLARRA